MNEPLKQTAKVRGFLDAIETWQKFLGLIVAIVAGFYAATTWVRTTAHNAVLDEKFLVTLASRVRPGCIFDSHGSIEADFGAGEYIEDIRVVPVPSVNGYEVFIKTKRHLAYAPLLSGVNINLYPETITRGKLHDWTILMSPQSSFTSLSVKVDESSYTNSVYRFKLEILH